MKWFIAYIKFLTNSSYLRNFYYQQASKETFTGAYYLVSTIFFALTVFLSTVVYLMIRGKDFVKITAEGAGRITSEQSRNNNAPVNKGKDNIAFIGDMYPYYNIAGLSNLWSSILEKHLITIYSLNINLQ